MSQKTYTSNMAVVTPAEMYVNESYSDTDAHIDYDSTILALTCTFDIQAIQFTGLLHVRFDKSGSVATVTQYVNNNSTGIMFTTNTMSGTTHITVPVIIEQGTFRVRVAFDSAGAPSYVKFDLIGFNH